MTPPLESEQDGRSVWQPSWLGIPAGVWLIAVLSVAFVILQSLRNFFDASLLTGEAFIRIWSEDNHDVMEPAYNLLTGRGYVLDGRPTAYREPGNALLNALALAVFGVRYSAIQITNGVSVAAAVILSYKLSKETFGETAGRWGAALVGANLLYLNYGVYPTCDAALYPVVVAMLLMLGRYLRDPRTSHLLWTGTWLAVATLLRGSTLLCAPIICLILLYHRRSLKPAIVAMLPFVLVVGTWQVRNYLVFHRYIPMATRLGIALITDNSYAGLQVPFFAPWRMVFNSKQHLNELLVGHPPQHAPAFETFRDDRYKAEAMRYIGENPGLYLKHCLRRSIALFSPTLIHHNYQPRWLVWMQVPKYFLVIVPGFIGLWRWRREPWAQASAGMIAIHAVFHVFIGIDGHRYRIGIEPMFALAASQFLALSLPGRLVGKPAVAAATAPAQSLQSNS